MAIRYQSVVADFETTTDPNDLRVWAACAVDIDTLETVHLSNSIDSFFKWLEGRNTKCYFHNLKFDAEFLLAWLLRNGYKYEKKEPKKPRHPRTFDTLITDTGVFYMIEVIFSVKNKKYKKVTFYDSLKKLPFKVSEISKAFKLKDSKLTIDYDAPRPVGHVLTDEEREYIVNDCRIVAAALQIQFAEGLKRMTNASDAFNWYKDTVGPKQFERCFPVFPVALDKDIRHAYRGGFVYLKPEHKNRRGLKGITLDVNSLYPWALRYCPLPYSYPVYFEGEPDWNDPDYPLFIVKIECMFEVKKDHLPTIQLKNSSRFIQTEYITSSKIKLGDDYVDEMVELTLTSVDLQLFLDHYDVDNLIYHSGFKFKASSSMFIDYVDYWADVKAREKGPKRQLAKLMLNSLYGRYALSTRRVQKVPILDEDDVVVYPTGLEKEEETEPVYTALAAFVTAYAREKTIRSAQSVYDRFIYGDTDSLHLIGYEMPEGLEVHPTKLGAWKHEGSFDDSVYIRAKTYMETMHEVKDATLENYATALNTAAKIERHGDKLDVWTNKVTCAGMPDNVKETVTYENFNYRTTFEGKLVPKRCPGGVVLVETTFTLL